MTDTTSSQDEKIIIDLSKSVNPRAFLTGSIIHKMEFQKVCDWINEQIKEVDKKDIDARYNDTISIFGSRGSGKTSFVLSVLEKYKDDRNVEVLEIIDPTLIEEKGHIVFNDFSSNTRKG